jgi:hypothetical protein
MTLRRDQLCCDIGKPEVINALREIAPRAAMTASANLIAVSFRPETRAAPGD